MGDRPALKGASAGSGSPPKDDPSADGAATPDIAAMQATIEELKGRVDGLSAGLGKSTAALEKIASTLTLKEKKSEAEDNTLTARVRRQEELTQKSQARLARDTIASTLLASGIEAERSPKMASYLLHEFGQRLKVSDEGDVFMLDGEKEVNASEYVKAYLQADGKWLLPPKTPPTDRGAAKGGGAIRTSADGVKHISYSDYVARKISAKDLEGMKDGTVTIDMPEPAIP